jgi:hypothetical protein
MPRANSLQLYPGFINSRSWAVGGSLGYAVMIRTNERSFRRRAYGSIQSLIESPASTVYKQRKLNHLKTQLGSLVPFLSDPRSTYRAGSLADVEGLVLDRNIEEVFGQVDYGDDDYVKSKEERKRKRGMVSVASCSSDRLAETPCETTKAHPFLLFVSVSVAFRRVHIAYWILYRPSLAHPQPTRPERTSSDLVTRLRPPFALFRTIDDG